TCFDQSLRFIACKGRQRSGEHKLLAFKALISLRTAPALSFSSNADGSQPITKRAVPFIVKPITHTLSHRQSNLGNRVQLFHRRFRQLIERAKLVREYACSSLTNMTDAERINQI